MPMPHGIQRRRWLARLASRMSQITHTPLTKKGRRRREQRCLRLPGLQRHLPLVNITAVGGRGQALRAILAELQPRPVLKARRCAPAPALRGPPLLANGGGSRPGRPGRSGWRPRAVVLQRLDDALLFWAVGRSASARRGRQSASQRADQRLAVGRADARPSLQTVVGRARRAEAREHGGGRAGGARTWAASSNAATPWRQTPPPRPHSHTHT